MCTDETYDIKQYQTYTDTESINTQCDPNGGQLNDILWHLQATNGIIAKKTKRYLIDLKFNLVFRHQHVFSISH